MELIKELGFEKLPTRTEFDKVILSTRNNENLNGSYQRLHAIKDFMECLQQKPELWMFVPAIKKDGVWVVLEEPICKSSSCHNESQNFCDCFDEEIDEYKEALDRVLFDGWRLHFLGKEGEWALVNNGKWMKSIYNETLEEAVNNGIELKLK